MADLMYLRSFIAIYRSGSITRASQYLNLSQPAVSGQLRMLEQQIGRELFTRTSRGIVPTAVAHELARSSGPHIDALDALGDKTQSSDYEGTVRLGGPIEFLTQRVLPALSQLVRNGLRFRVTLAVPETLIEQLSNNVIDLAVAGTKTAKSGILYDPLYAEELALVASPYWANLLPRQAELNVEHLARVPLLAYDEDMPLISVFWESVFGTGLEERTGRRCGSQSAGTHGTRDSRRWHLCFASLLLRRRAAARRVGGTVTTAKSAVKPSVPRVHSEKYPLASQPCSERSAIKSQDSVVTAQTHKYSDSQATFFRLDLSPYRRLNGIG
jgi:DNA-binding transcriptional LysR family regulator